MLAVGEDVGVAVGWGVAVLVWVGMTVAVARVGLAAATIWVAMAVATVGEGALEQADKKQIFNSRTNETTLVQ